MKRYGLFDYSPEARGLAIQMDFRKYARHCSGILRNVDGQIPERYLSIIQLEIDRIVDALQNEQKRIADFRSARNNA